MYIAGRMCVCGLRCVVVQVAWVWSNLLVLEKAMTKNGDRVSKNNESCYFCIR